MIYCWFIQKTISWKLDSNQPLSGFLQHHVNSCVDCQRFHQSELQVIRELIHSAPPMRIGPSAYFEARLTRALKAETSRPSAPATGLPHFGWVAALGISAALLLVVSLLHYQPNPPEPPQTAAAPAVTIQIPPPSRIDLARGKQLIELGLTAEAPLEKEMHLLVNDARLVMASLAMNFLPNETTWNKREQ